jgi:hypothetical protein
VAAESAENRPVNSCAADGRAFGRSDAGFLSSPLKTPDSVATAER